MECSGFTLYSPQHENVTSCFTDIFQTLDILIWPVRGSVLFLDLPNGNSFGNEMELASWLPEVYLIYFCPWPEPIRSRHASSWCDPVIWPVVDNSNHKFGWRSMAIYPQCLYWSTDILSQATCGFQYSFSIFLFPHVSIMLLSHSNTLWTSRDVRALGQVLPTNAVSLLRPC